MTANGEPVDLSRPARLAPGNERLQIRYTGIHLSAPERVQYFYRLEGLDTDWVAAGGAARDQLQQPAARALSIHRAGGTARRAWQPSNPTRSKCCRSSRRRRGSALLCVAAAAGGGVGDLPTAAAADPVAVRAGAGRARAAGARDPRHAGAGLRRHLLAAGRGGHVHAERADAGAPLPGHGAAHGAAQPDRSAPRR